MLYNYSFPKNSCGSYKNHTDIENFKLQALFRNQSKSTFNFNINMPLIFDLLLTF